MKWYDQLAADPISQKWPALIHIMLSRLLLLGVLLLGYMVLLPRSGDAFYVFIGLAFIVTIPYALWLRSEATTSISAPYQFTLDVLIITGLVHFTGGIRSELSLLYPLVILAAGIIVSGRLAIQAAIFSTLAYMMLVLMEMEGLLDYRGPPPPPYDDHLYVIRELMVRVVIFSFFAAAAGFITDRCFFQDKQLRRLQALGQLIFDNVAAPLLGVRPDGRIVIGNQAATRVFSTPAATLNGRHINELLRVKVQDIEELGKTHKLWEFVDSQGQLIPCMVETEKAHIPAFTMDSVPFGPGETEMYLLVFHDMRELLKREAEDGRVDRLHAVAGMIAEMAHEVRNPLTAIKSAGDLLSHTADAAAKQRRTVTAHDWQAISSICDIISQETNRLDDKVQYFMECAVRDPEKLRLMTEQAEIWQGKLSHLREQGNGENTDC